MKFTGQTALITGASSGIGAAYAQEFASDGADLVLVARSEQALEKLAADLRATHGRRVDVIPLDLGAPDAADLLAGKVAALGVQVDILINNAGFGLHGDFVDADPDRLTAMIQLNCVAMVNLTRRIMPGMIARRRGTIINVASTAAFQPLPHMALYGATKAFVLSFTEALWAEAKPAGVKVLAISPGATETPFFAIAGEAASIGRRRTPQQVVATTMAALDRGRPSRIDGLTNTLLAAMPRFAPRRTVIATAGRSLGSSRRA
jgi:short-subunit dehydrogenase